jgi:hypothetical protein
MTQCLFRPRCDLRRPPTCVPGYSHCIGYWTWNLMFHTSEVWYESIHRTVLTALHAGLQRLRFIRDSFELENKKGLVNANTGQFKKKVTLSHVYNEASFRIQNAFCCGVAILQHRLPWRRRPETTSARQLQTLRIFLTIVVHRVIVVSLVTSL